MLSDTLSNLLDRPITEETAHSRTVCEDCLKLCTEFDVLFNRLDAIKTHVLQCYNDTIETHYCMDIIDTDNVDKEMLPGKPAEETDVYLLKSVTLNDYDEVLPSPQDHTNQPDPEQHGKREQLVSTSSTNVSRLLEDIFQIPEAQDVEDQYAVFTGNATNLKQEIFDAPEVEISTETEADRYNDHFAMDDDAISQTSHRDYLHDLDPLDASFRPGLESKDGLKATEVMVCLDPEEPDTYEDVTVKPIFVREGTSFKCQLCDESADEIFDHKSIVEHMRALHNERVFVCDLCGADYRQKMELSQHMEEHENGEIVVKMECEVCQRVFTNVRQFRIHTKTHHSIETHKSVKGTAPKSWMCKFCNKKFNSRKLMEEHKNKHTGERPYKCVDCPKDFASKYTLTAHMKIHSDRKRPYACQACPKTFYSHQNLAQHERTHTGVKEHVCGVCDRAFGTAHNLEVHKIVHTGYKPFLCRTCGKAFARRAEIRDHERVHTGERPFVCDLCGASFAQRSNLTSHKRATHLNDKRYKCEECGKTFKRRRLLDYHCKASHTGERPYACEMCGSTFVYPEHYRKHLRIHTGVKPFQCEVCGKAFNSRDNRNAHRFVHSDKKPYECLFCGVGFMRKPQLLAHMKIYNHENKRIILNQPRIIADGPDDGSGKTLIDSNVVYIDDCVDAEEPEEFEIDNVYIYTFRLPKIYTKLTIDFHCR